MSEYKIEKDVPIPPKNAGRGSKYPFPEMEVGDSILVELKQSSAATLTRAIPDMKFATRKVEGGTRIWRIA